MEGLAAGVLTPRKCGTIDQLLEADGAVVVLGDGFSVAVERAPDLEEGKAVFSKKIAELHGGVAVSLVSSLGVEGSDGGEWWLGVWAGRTPAVAVFRIGAQ